MKTKNKKYLSVADLGLSTENKKLMELAGETINIFKLEQRQSEQYGTGYIVHFTREKEKNKSEYTSGVFAPHVVELLDLVYKMTNKGKMLSKKYPFRATVRKTPKSYVLE